jgi:hypothetical protein
MTIPATVPESEPEALSFETPKLAFHAVRVICDELGLSLVQKNTLCACVYQESAFMNYRAPGVPMTNPNKDKTGKVWSTDYGICQVNDYFHIGPGKDFPSVAYVLANPEKVVRWMAGIMKRTGGLAPWASYSSGAYHQWLSPVSPMWQLKS